SLRNAGAGLIALTLVTSGCQWIEQSMDSGSISELLDTQKTDDEDIKRAALKDSSFPAATQPSK
ncbi:MAG: hypothetical protein N2C12_13775, partial [Planctomycetales bacterium]